MSSTPSSTEDRSCRGADARQTRRGSKSCSSLVSRRAAGPLVKLVAGEERFEAPDHLQGVLHENWGGTDPNRTAT
ncbi:hypothetical protein TNCV_1626991 [Trichonephila clavipes]|nr:hypothetical protein TNCV_1626991 [Trichonephila clavipes]